MTYFRLPNSRLPGRGLKQRPESNGDAGVLAVTLDSDIATTQSLGIVQVGSGLSITPEGILSANGGGGGDNCTFSITLVDDNYTPNNNDCFIGVTKKDKTITLPVGIVGKCYMIKNQADGNVKILGSNGQKIDSNSFKTLGSNDSLMIIFDGYRWNII